MLFALAFWVASFIKGQVKQAMLRKVRDYYRSLSKVVSQHEDFASTAYLSEWSIFIYCWVILQKMGWFENKPHLLISML